MSDEKTSKVNEKLLKPYEPKETEGRIYKLWEKSGYFNPDNLTERNGQTFTIALPPPNVTGTLHMGHALNATIQDILIRQKRMQGYKTLWIPGTDHAGIATQNVVEKDLKKQGISRHDLGKEKFLEKVWEWKEKYGNIILDKLKKIGSSCDWSRTRFTMDEKYSEAVKVAFLHYHKKGWIYQGERVINWCPRCQTSLSDLEIEHLEQQSKLYFIKYPLKNNNGFIIVATTRPETMLGDTAVAVNPNDERYKHLHGKKILLPLVNRLIPVITDEFVDPEFGTGIVKVTPAHDPNDFAMGHRHNLEQVNILTPDGKINEHGGPYKGMDRFEARKKIVHDLEAQGLFIKRDSHLHAVGHCYRCDTMVEPYLSKQWFVKMQPLAEKALKAHEKGKTVFTPDRWTKVYLNWLKGIRDWCISRQIWWGHRLPVWYCAACAAKLQRHKPQSHTEKPSCGMWPVT